MKRYISILFFFFLSLFRDTDCYANHIFGGDLLYTNLGNDSSYQVKLTLYGDCGAAASLLSSLYSAQPRVVLYNGNSFADSFFLTLVPGSGNDVTPVCPDQVSQTACNGGSLPGVRQFIYTANVKIKIKSPSLRMVFQGDLHVASAAGRSSHITNIAGSGTSLMQIEADLNNYYAPNSSPQYSTIPTPFYCINFEQQYNQGAADPNGDSLVFSLVPAIDANTNSPVNYVYPLSATYPLQTSAGGFNFNPLNGQMTFTPNHVQEGLIVNRVSEYRGGLLVGTSEREMTFIVQDNCTGTAPTVTIANIVGATVTNGTVINICKNAPHVSFDIQLINPDADVTVFHASNVPSSASLLITNDSTPNAGASFSWNTDTLSVGTYSFYLNVKSDHCPIYFTQTIAYTINVANPPTITDTQLSATQCVHGAAIRFDLTGGFVPRTVTVKQGSTIINTVIDNTGTAASGSVIDSLPAGSYVAIVSSDSLCTGSVAFTITDSGSLPYVHADESLCKGDNASPVTIPLADPSATITWYNIAGSPLLGPPLPNTFAPASYTWYFIETYKTCSTGPDTVHVVVHDLPTAKIIDIPNTICYGDDIYLQATGGVKYEWQPESAIHTDSTGQYVVMLNPITLTVTAIDANNCSDTALITYDNIQPCCNFSYPTAFTPNNDGNNDGFRIVTYGNMLHYSLSIYNRWGQRVFWTSDPDHRWDGTFNGQPCETGVYYYFMQGQCLTGRKEEHRGDVTLVH